MRQGNEERTRKGQETGVCVFMSEVDEFKSQRQSVCVWVVVPSVCMADT